MYHHPGEYVTDFCLIQREGVHHLFHIRGERCTWPIIHREIDLGHAISTDLRHWTPQAPVLPVGPPGAWDEAGNWAPDIIEVDGTYYIFYTGADANLNQKIGLGTSTDLYHWTKDPANPLVAPGPWSDRAVGKNVACRDAMVYADTARDRYLMYYTATMADGRACIALAQSRDLIAWEDLGPTYIEEDRTYNRCESAYLVRHGDWYYLFYSAKGGPNSKGSAPEAFAHFDIVYLMSQDPTGGWTKPANHELLAGWMCASEHPTFDGRTFMLFIIQEETNGLWGASSLSDPKEIVWLPDGTVQVREYLPPTVERQPIFIGETDGFDDWLGHGGLWQAGDGGLLSSLPDDAEGSLMNTLWGRDLVMEAEVLAQTDGVASLLVRANPSATAGYRLSLDFRNQMVAMFRRFPYEADQLLQARSATLTRGLWHKLKVVVQGKFFEIYVDDALSIVRDHRLYEDGCFGLHALGQVSFRNVRVYTDIGPVEADPTWNIHCRPRHLYPLPDA